jgi:glycerol-3-phosphate acyltransferase PlsX
MKIAVDGYGGDHAPEEIVKGVIQALDKSKNLEIILTGKKEVLSSLAAGAERLTIIDAPDVITNDEAPTTAIRSKKNSSLVAALNLLKDGTAEAMVSAGSTGAVLTGAFMIAGRIKGISRPALAPVLPTVNGGNVILIDCGANVDCKPVNLAHFAIMGTAYAKAMLGIANPRVALLSNGVEDKKGNELNRQAFPILKEMKDINFVGNMEARELISGEYDVVVADGFDGNIALKASEGIAKSMLKLLKQAINDGGIKTKIGALLMKPALYSLKDKMDYSSKGGAAFLGIEKVIIKSHGSSKAESICASILQAAQLSEGGVVAKIKDGLKDFTLTEND